MLKQVFAAVAASVLVVVGVNAQQVVEGSLDPDAAGRVIPPEIYGQFVEHLGAGVYDGIWVGPDSDIPNTRGVRDDVVAALSELKVPVVRWPGGCFADEYHWRDGIGPRDARPMRKNNWWGASPEPNSFGTHEFFDFAEMIGAKTYLSVNVASSNPTEMREWIEYITSDDQDDLANERRANGREEPFSLDYVGIGNESWGCGGAMRPEYYSDLYRRWAVFFHGKGHGFHDNQDNTALRVASGANNDDTNWTNVVVDRAGGMMDAISLHFYTVLTGDWQERNQAPATGFPEEHWNQILYQANRLDGIITAHEEVMDQHDPDRRISLFVDEWGTWYAPEPGTEPGHAYQQNTLRDALVAAISFNILHEHTDRVRMANIAQTVNVLQAMLLTDGAAMAKTPTFYAFRMYTPFQGATGLPLTLDAPVLEADDGAFPAITATAARTEDGALVVAAANLDRLEPYSVQIDLGGMDIGAIAGEILTHELMDAHNIPGEPEVIAPTAYEGAAIEDGRLVLEMPAKSLVVVTLQ